MLEQLQYRFNLPELDWRQVDASKLQNNQRARQINQGLSPYWERSMSAIASHLPGGWMDSILKLLTNEPILVRVVRHRKSKHGDHLFDKHQQRSIITVNASGNGYRFAITLLHEIAHARISHRYLRRMKPHGREWKSSFRNLLLDHRDLFPEDLRPAVLDYAQNPLYTTDADSSLSQTLRKYDTLDLRPTVAELSAGQTFSLNGKLILTKGQRLRKRFKCSTDDGRTFHVSPAARVHAIYDSSTAAP